MKRLNELNSDEREKHIQKFGGFNDPPPNMQEITPEEFAQSKFFVYTPVIFEFRQISPNLCKNEADRKRLFGDEQAVQLASMFYVDGPGVDGFIMISDYWKKKVRYFTFSQCVHSYRGMTQAELHKHNITLYKCTHAYICDKCGVFHIQGSSD